MFSLDVLAKSCAIGKKNAQFAKLNVALLKSVKGKCSGICMCACVFTITFHLELMYISFSTTQDMREEEMNRVIINSACAGARCTLKATTQNDNN